MKAAEEGKKKLAISLKNDPTATMDRPPADFDPDRLHVVIMSFNFLLGLCQISLPHHLIHVSASKYILLISFNF